MICNRCFRVCCLGEGDVGECRAVACSGGALKSLNYGKVSSVSIGPLREKRIWYWNPDLRVLSVGSYGCNLKCKFCQNSSISQVGCPEPFKETPPLGNMGPEAVVKTAEDVGARGVAFTFSEPLMCLDFVKDVFSAARARGLKTALKSNGLVNYEMFADLIRLVDAANFDVKGDAKTYEEVCGDDRGGAHKQLKRNLVLAIKSSHVEISMPVIPGRVAGLAAAAEDVSALLGRDVPVHLLRVVPDYLMEDSPAPSREEMAQAEGIARSFFANVNV